MTQLKILQEGPFPAIISVSYRLFIFSYFFAGVHFALLGDSTLRCNHREPTLLFVNCKWKLNNIKFTCFVLFLNLLRCHAKWKLFYDTKTMFMQFMSTLWPLLISQCFMSQAICLRDGLWGEGGGGVGQKSKKKNFPRNQAEEHKNLASYAG